MNDMQNEDMESYMNELMERGYTFKMELVENEDGLNYELTAVPPEDL